MNKHQPATKLVLLASIISVILSLSVMMTLLANQSETLQNHLESVIPKTLTGGIMFILLLTPAMAIGLPRQFAALSAGFLFGASLGTFIATLSATLGCLLTVLLSRNLLSKRVQHHYPRPLAKVQSFFQHDTFIKALIIRLLPAGSNFLTNILAGTANSPIKAYILGSALGFIPQMLIFSLIGAGLQVNSQQQLFAGGALLIIAIILSSYLYKKSDSKYLFNK